MKYSIFKLTIVFIILLLISTKVFSQNYDLTIKIDGLENLKGNILFGLYNNGSNFPDRKKALKGKVLPIKEKEEKYTFKNLTAGNYAVAIIHDENKDGELNTNFLGIPKEGFGFSNNEIGTFGPPSFKKAAIKLQKNTVISIKIRYF